MIAINPATGTEEERKKMGSSVAIAVVSGKGGSGKTMVAVAMAQGCALAGRQVLLVDTDFGTGGLTYYLTFRAFQRARVGLADLAQDPSRMDTLMSWAAIGRADSLDHLWLANVRLVPVGDQRRVGEGLSDELLDTISGVIYSARQTFDVIIVDCRGGIDQQSLAVCSLCDEILVVVETDTTSIQASQHLMEMLNQRKLAERVTGFVLNKVLDDPSIIAKTASSLLKIDYIGAIPFDIEATRSYIQGIVPDSQSLFSTHVFATIPSVYPDMYYNYGNIRTLSPEEFSTVTLKTPEARYGTLVVAILTFYVMILCAWRAWSKYVYQPFSNNDGSYFTWIELSGYIAAFVGLVVAALSDRLKQTLGRIFLNSMSIIRRRGRANLRRR